MPLLRGGAAGTDIRAAVRQLGAQGAVVAAAGGGHGGVVRRARRPGQPGPSGGAEAPLNPKP